MNKYDPILKNYGRKILKAIKHLEYSYNKSQNLTRKLEELDEEALETWEGFTSRYARVVDLFLTKYIRAFVLRNDLGFKGDLRDFVNQAEKLKLIDSAERWMSYREYRNIEAQDYTEEMFTEFVNNLVRTCPELIALKGQIEQ